MTGKQTLQMALVSTQGMMPMYLGDLSDADILLRPVPGANHIAWQLGHLISSEKFLLGSQLPGATYPELPEGFDATHHGKNSGQESNTGFLTKNQYMELFTSVRKATLNNLEKINEADLEKPNTGPVAKFAPTLASLILLVSNHTLMHAGQFTVVRRKLGKPVAF